MAASAGDSALLSLVDQDDDEITTSQSDFHQSTKGGTASDTYIGMEDDTDQLLGDENPEDVGKKESPFTFAYYTKLFDVDTDEIVSRLIWSACPRPNYTSSFARKKIRSKPDLYGPFWIGVTLVFSVAIAGNVASYFQYQIGKDEPKTKHWHYDFHKVSVSAAIVFLYATLVPSGVFAMLWSGNPKENTSKPSFVELVCIFGYSLTPFVPISILWLIQISLVQWVLVLVSFLLSGGVLLLALWPIVNEFSTVKTKGYTIIAGVLGLHLLLASGFMLCFFHVPSNQEVIIAQDLTTAKPIHENSVKPEDVKAPEKPEVKPKGNGNDSSSHEGKREIHIKNLLVEDTSKEALEKSSTAKKYPEDKIPDVHELKTEKTANTDKVSKAEIDEKNSTKTDKMNP